MSDSIEEFHGSFCLTGNEEVDSLLATDPNALFSHMVLVQQQK